MTITAILFTQIGQLDSAVAVRIRKFLPLEEPIGLQDLLNSACSRAEKKDRTFNNLNTGVVCSSNAENFMLFVLPFSVEFTDNKCSTV